MLKICSYANFTEKSIGAEHCAELRTQELQRYRSIVSKITREINRGHTAGAYLTLDVVPVAKAVLECLEQIHL